MTFKIWVGLGNFSRAKLGFTLAEKVNNQQEQHEEHFFVSNQCMKSTVGTIVEALEKNVHLYHRGLLQ